MTPRKKLAIILGTLILVVALILLAWWLRGLLSPKADQATPAPSPTIRARTLGKDKFAPKPRPQAAANVDIGVRTVSIASTTKPSASPVPGRRQAYPPTDPQQPNSSQLNPVQTPSPLPSAPATPPPLLAAPTFAALPPAPASQDKEVAVVYAKNEPGKRQIYIRSLDRENDDQLVTSPYDDYGVAFSTATQKVAFYSSEEGTSDASRPKAKLKVVDLATGKVYPITQAILPGEWPAAWSGDGKKLAIPTANSIFIADVTTGTSLQVPTGKQPGAIVWAPGNLKFYFQAEAGTGNTDLFEVDAITAQARPVVTTPEAESIPSVSGDGSKLAFLRGQTTDKSSVVVKNLTTSEEKTFTETLGVGSYLWNFDFTRLLFAKQSGDGKVQSLKGTELSDVGGPSQSLLIGWDRDYDHIFILAREEQARNLLSLDIGNGATEKIKPAVADAPQSITP